MKIKDICVGVTDGSHNPPQGIEHSDYLMLSSKNVFDGSITFDDPRYLSQSDFEQEHKRTNVQPGDILLTIVGTVGRTAVVDNAIPCFTLQRSVAVLHPKKDLCNSRYLMYALQGKRDYIENHAKGVAQKGIYLKEVSDIDIVVPPVSDQIEIVSVLDKISSIIHGRQQELRKLDELVKARFVELFGDTKANDKRWETNTLLETLEEGSSVSYGIVQTGDDVDGGVPVFRPIDIAGGHTPRRKELKRTEKEISDKYKRTLLKGYELLITVRGSVGETFQVTEEFAGCNVGRNIVPLRFDTNKVLYKYMEHFFAQSGTKDILASMTKGIALQGLNMSEFRDIAVIMPSIEQQARFVEFANQVDKSKVAVQKALDEAQLLFDSLMQEYFGT